MESITITARRRPSRSRVNPSFSGSLPGYPEIEDEWMEGEEGEALPLPDHFPEPCMDPDQEVKESRASITLEQGATLVFCPPQQALTSAPSPVTSAPPAVTSAVTSVPPAVTSAVTSVLPAVTSAVTSATPAVTSAVTSAPPAVTSAVTSAQQAVTSAVTSAPPAVTSAVTSAQQPALTSAVTSVPPAVTSAVTSAHQPEVTSAQQPSVVTKPTLVIPKPEVTFGKKPPPPTSPKPAVTSSSKTPPPTSPKPVMTSGTSPLVRSAVSKAHVTREGQNGAKEGVKRITDKYATPGTLLRNVSVSSADARPPAASPRETLPSSPTPSITLTPSPSFFFPNNASAPASHGQSPDSVTASSAASTNSTPTPSDSNVLTLPLPVPGRGSGHSLSSESVSAFSDMSSEMSDSLASPFLRNSVFTSSGRESGLVGTSRYQSVSGIPLTASLGDGVTDQDVQQVEMFYRSHKSEVTVCRCLANLYLGSAASKTSSGSIPAPSNGRVSSSAYSDLWEFVTTGIPLVVQDSGRHHRCRQLTIVLAEKGTGFVLWKDAVNSLSHYSCPDSNFHTLTLSTDAKKLVGLSFDDSKAAGEFGTYITKLTAEMDDDSGTLTRKGKRKKKQESKKVKCKMPKKTDISQPCCFQHITKLERPQITGVMPLPPNSFPAAHGNTVSGLSDILRDRLSVSSRTHSYSSDLSEACTLASER